MKKFLSMLAIAAMVTSFMACDDDDNETPDGPTITAPAVTNAQVSTSADVTFPVSIPGGFKSYEVTATGGTATKKSEPAAGAKDGNIVVTYAADAAAGAGTVTITVTDNNDKTESESAAINKTPLAIPDVVVVSGILETQTWTADNIYELAGRVIVKDGATLTIEPGTIIKGREGSTTLASVLIISRGAKIMAEGTAEKPIIFTSVLDDITVNQKMGTNLTKEDNTKWGGLIILGKAPISAKNGDTESSIEGLPANEPYAVYGGDVADDNSGVLKYVSIRHGGILIGSGNEINGLTLGGVGSGTTIENIEVFATLDDGIEFFGGTVNVTNALVYWQGDDGIDIDQNYSGTVTNFAVYHGDGVNTDEGLEIDGPEGTTHKDGLFKLVNGTLKADDVAGSAADIKADAQGTLENLLFSNYPGGAKLNFEGEYAAGDCSDHSTKTYKDAVQNLLDDALMIIGSKYDVIGVYSKKDANEQALCSSVPDTDKTAAAAKATSKTDATGADTSVFAWTAGSLTGL